MSRLAAVPDPEEFPSCATRKLKPDCERCHGAGVVRDRRGVECICVPCHMGRGRQHHLIAGGLPAGGGAAYCTCGEWSAPARDPDDARARFAEHIAGVDVGARNV